MDVGAERTSSASAASLGIQSERRLGVAVADDNEVGAVEIDDPAIDGELELNDIKR